MLCHQSTYRGHIIGVERKGSIWFITASPKATHSPYAEMLAAVGQVSGS
jgi:hypothetical protein